MLYELCFHVHWIQRIHLVVVFFDLMVRLFDFSLRAINRDRVLNSLAQTHWSSRVMPNICLGRFSKPISFFMLGPASVPVTVPQLQLNQTHFLKLTMRFARGNIYPTKFDRRTHHEWRWLLISSRNHICAFPIRYRYPKFVACISFEYIPSVERRKHK